MGYSYKQGKTYSDWLRLYVKHNWLSLVVLILLALFGVGFELIGPLPIQTLIDSVFGDAPLPAFIEKLGINKGTLLIALIISYAVIHLLSALFQLLQSYVQIKANQKIDIAAMDEEFSAVARIPYNDQVRGNPMNNIYQVTSQSQMLSGYILSNPVAIIQSILTLSGTLVTLFLISAPLLLIVVLTFPFLAVITVKFGRKIEARAIDTETSHGAVYSFVSESLEKLRTIQAFAYVAKRSASLVQLVKIRNRFATKQMLTNESYSLLISCTIVLSMTAALAVGSFSVQNGSMTLGFLVVVLTYMEIAFGQVSVIAETLGSISAQKATMLQAYEPIERAGLFISQGKTTPFAGNIEFFDVTLKKGITEILKNINLKIPAGSIVGIVGPSGGGKTTFINSLLRFTEPFSGQILIDNVNVQSYDVNWLRSNISLVEQEPDLFDGTINENIALSDPTRQFDLLDIMAAGSVAELTEFLRQKHLEGDELIDNNKLSGGQKQRIAIARAIYKRSPIIIMDEPTSALDPLIGHKIIENIIASANSHTILIITHDLSLLKKLPSVLVVGNGTIQDINQHGGVDAYFTANSDLLK